MSRKRIFVTMAFSVALLITGCGTDRSENVSTGSQSQTDRQEIQNSQSNQNSQDSQNLENNSSIISEEEAKSIALTDAQVEAEAVTNIRIKLAVDDGTQEYEVDFYVNDQEYDYDIDAVTGKITSKDMEIENDFGSQASANASVTIEKARKIALDKVPGATENDIHIALDYDDGKMLYEGSILYEQIEYEFEIDAQNGQIWSWEEESIWD